MNHLPAVAILRLVTFAAAFAAFLPGCIRNGRAVEQYGRMRAVLHEGKSEPRVALAAVTAKPHAYAVGALAGLGGEVTIVDGSATVSRVHDGALRSGPPEVGDRATLLSVAHVERWRSATLDHAAADRDLERAIRDIAAAAGVDAMRPFAFVIEGELTALDLHVINGACPAVVGEARGPNAPWRLRLSTPRKATLVGFYAQGRAGEMTHHGSNVHVHAVLEHEGDTITGHVDSVTIAAGAAVRVPSEGAQRY